MNPKNSEQLTVALDGSLTNSEKQKALLPETQGFDFDIAEKVFEIEDLIEDVKRYTSAMHEEPHHEEAVTESHTSKVNFRTPRLAILATEEGRLELEFFIYTPNEPYYQKSINARWFMRDKSNRLNILQEYVAAKPLQKDKLLRIDLVRQSFEAYQEAWQKLVEKGQSWVAELEAEDQI
jgi:hypothetical protein